MEIWAIIPKKNPWDDIDVPFECANGEKTGEVVGLESEEADGK